MDAKEMDAGILEAINSKIRDIFSSDDATQFLSFPVSLAYSFSPEELSWNSNGGSADAGSSLNTMAEFARMMNLPVKGESYDIGLGEERLWDIYGEILKYALWAVGSDTTEDKGLIDARKFLYKTNSDGFDEKSEQYAKYLELRDALFAAREELFNLNSEGDKDSSLKQLKEKELEEIERKLAEDGLANKVEAYLSLISQYNAKNPTLYWKSLKERFIPETTMLTDLQGGEFAPTYIFPRDVLSQKWNKIVLTTERLRKPVIKRRIPTPKKVANVHMGKSRKVLIDENADGVKQISFEYRSVKIERPWFDKDLFKSRYWRLGTGSKALSIGLDSYEGRMPSYITAIVLSRNFKIERNDGTVVEENNDKDMVSILAYICKKLDRCPNPNPNADWGTDEKFANVTIDSSAKKYVSLFVGGNAVSEGVHLVGSQITCKVIQRDGKVVVGWLVNEKKIPDKNGKCVLTLAEEGLVIEPIWEDVQDASDIKAEIDGTILKRLTLCPENLDMNKYSALRDVTQIDKNAFADNTKIRSLIISPKVKNIDANAFLGCKNLTKVFVPDSTVNIHSSAFDSDNKEVEIVVDSENPRYKVSANNVITKDSVANMPVYRCSCKAIICADKLTGNKCPRCGKDLTEDMIDNDSVFEIPKKSVQFEVEGKNAKEKAKEFFRGQFVTLDEFKKSLDDIAFSTTKLFLPVWTSKIKASGQYKFCETVVNKVVGEDGKESEQTTTNLYTRDVKTEGLVQTYPCSLVYQHLKGNCKDASESHLRVLQKDAVVELTDTSRADIKKKARAGVEGKLIKDASRRPADTLQNKQTVYDEEEYELVLCPLWKLDYDYAGIHYSILIDGKTGDISEVPDYPKDEKKVKQAKIAQIVFIVVSLLVLFLCFFFMMR